ncbi:hypothetical protein [Klebsiella variicola]|uniref:hypothetical protein n=1 Tax=Klebsiella variicola TaxID=244366 RepID=UPI001F26EF34|nr:hypothetical protein [Klebsiella variicola]GKL99180.1 hypothetical protein NUKP64_36770 [Klebsiella variicola]
MKKKKASELVLLTSDSDWHNNACLNYMSDHGTAYIKGYRRLVTLMCLDGTRIFWFIRCCYHIEPLIKQIVGLVLALAEEPGTDQYKKDNHNLNTLWLLAKKLLPEVNDSHRSSNFRLIKEVVKKLHNAHRLVTDLRYARRNDDTRSFEGIQDVNTSCFREKWKRLPIH